LNRLDFQSFTKWLRDWLINECVFDDINVYHYYWEDFVFQHTIYQHRCLIEQIILHQKWWNNQVFRLRDVFNEDYFLFDFFVSFLTFISTILNFLNFEQSRLKWLDSSQLKHLSAFINFFLIESRLNVLKVTRDVKIRNWLKFQIVVFAEICSTFSLIEIEIVMMLIIRLIATFVSISIVATALDRRRNFASSIRL
jgi:hypothetical protein